MRLSPFNYLNYTEMTTYEALEKNAISNRRMRYLANLRYGIASKWISLWGDFGCPCRKLNLTSS